MTHITPTVGRIVHYHPRPGEIEAGTVPDPMGQPCAAIVAHVVQWTDPLEPQQLHLHVIDARGCGYPRTFVPLIQEGDAKPEASDWCEWMPYQKDVAAGKIAPTLHAKPNTTGL